MARGAHAPQAASGGFFQFTPSNDLYGSFCRVRVSLQSDDKKIQDVIAKGTDWAVTYFAAGDAFTCGSWIPEKALNDLANAVAKDARDDAAQGNGRTKSWMTLLGTLGGGALGGVAGNKIADSSFLGGLTGNGSTKDNNSNAESCVKAADNYISTRDTGHLTRMLNYARKIDDKESSDKKQELDKAYKDLRDEMIGITPTQQATNNNGSVECKVVRGDLNKIREAIGSNSKVAIIDATIGCTTVTSSGKDVSKVQASNSKVIIGVPEDDTVAGISGIDAAGNLVSDGFIASVGKKADINGCVGGKYNWGSMTISQTAYINGSYRDVTEAAFIICPEDSNVSYEDIKATQTSARYDGAVVKVAKGAAATANNTTQTAGLAAKVTALSDACAAYTNNKSNQKTKSISTAVGIGVGAIAGGVLAYQATKSIQDAKLDKVEKEAYDEWMNDVGNHIRCFVGGDEVGMFGDTITTSME